MSGAQDEKDRVAEFTAFRKRMNELKTSYTAVLTVGILGLVGMGPRQLQKQALDFLARKGTAVMTNVPGPQQPLYLAGCALREMMFWVPQTGSIGIGLSILIKGPIGLIVIAPAISSRLTIRPSDAHSGMKLCPAPVARTVPIDLSYDELVCGRHFVCVC